jgi:hypothetical protein
MVAKTPIKRAQTVKRGDNAAWDTYEASLAEAEESHARGVNDELFIRESIAGIGLDGAGELGLKLMRDPSQPQGFTRVYRLTGPNKGRSFDYPTLWLRQLLQQRHPADDPRDPDAGKPAYTIRKNMAPEPTQGSQVCFLHPEFEDIDTVRELGITSSCFKDNLPRGRMGRSQHCSMKHKAEWNAYQDFLKEQREDAQRETDTAFRESVAAAVKGKE